MWKRVANDETFLRILHDRGKSIQEAGRGFQGIEGDFGTKNLSFDVEKHLRRIQSVPTNHFDASKLILIVPKHNN